MLNLKANVPRQDTCGPFKYYQSIDICIKRTKMVFISFFALLMLLVFYFLSNALLNQYDCFMAVEDKECAAETVYSIQYTSMPLNYASGV